MGTPERKDQLDLKSYKMTALKSQFSSFLLKTTRYTICRQSNVSCLIRRFSVTSLARCNQTQAEGLSNEEHEQDVKLQEQEVKLPDHLKIDERGINYNAAELKKLKKTQPNQPKNPRCMKIALIGTPNAGKSTLANKLLGHRFSPASNKVHTTQESTLGVLTEGDTQLIFLDTPGMTTPTKQKKHKLQRSLLTDPHSALFHADMIAVVCDVSHVWGCSRIDAEVLKALYLHQSKDSVLILNKVDQVKRKDSLLKYARVLSQNRVDGKTHSFSKKQKEKQKEKEDIDRIINKIAGQLNHGADSSSGWHNAKIDSSGGEAMNPINHNAPHVDSLIGEEELEQLSDLSDTDAWNKYYKLLSRAHQYTLNNVGWPNFKQIFMVSALESDGLDYLKDELMTFAPERPWEFHESLVTTQDPREIGRLAVWEKVMDNLRDDLPYKIKVKLTMFEHSEETGLLQTGFDLLCNGRREVRHLLGKNGRCIRKIQQEARQELMNTFHTEVFCSLRVVDMKDVEAKS